MEFWGSFMEILKLIALLIGAALIFVSCSANSYPTLSYQEKSFRAHISWQLGADTDPNSDSDSDSDSGSSSYCFSAVYTSRPHENGKDVTLEITSPDELNGLCIGKKNGVFFIHSDDLEISTPFAERLLAVSELFEIDATVTESSIQELDGKKLNMIEARSSDGRCFTLFLFPESGLPRRICAKVNGNDCTLDVIAFEFA